MLKYNTDELLASKWWTVTLIWEKAIRLTFWKPKSFCFIIVIHLYMQIIMFQKTNVSF